MLVQAGAKGAPIVAAPAASPSPTPDCATHFRVTFVADVAGMRSAVDAAGWQGVQLAARERPCLQGELIASAHPSEYRNNLQAGVDRHADLVIAGSFLLSGDAVDAALANPRTHFVLINPLVPTSGPPNLAIVTFREDQAGYLAGALAGMTTKTGVIAGVYGLEDDHDLRYRSGFERGAQDVNSSVRVLGAFQGPGDGAPYANPSWGAAQARDFVDQNADVVFGSGDGTGRGALTAAAEAAKACITIGFALNQAAPSCLTATVLLHVDRAVAEIITAAAAGNWQGGERAYGAAEGAIGLAYAPRSPPPPDVRRRLQVLTDLLAGGKI